MKNALITGKTHQPKLKKIFDLLQEELSLLQINSFIVPYNESNNKEFDIVFSIGGDGSFISTSRKYVHFNKPIVAIKGGTVGFLTNIDPKELRTELPKIIDPKYPWTKRMLITGSTPSSSKIIAINEFLFSSKKKGSLCYFTICINDEPVMQARADGILIATPTGSTAYNLSAGGPISLPNMELVTITPVCSHILGERPLVIGLNNKIQIVNDSHDTNKIWSDGQESIDLHKHEIFTIEEPLYIKSLHTNSKDFFNTLSHKLGWKKILDN